MFIWNWVFTIHWHKKIPEYWLLDLEWESTPWYLLPVLGQFAIRGEIFVSNCRKDTEELFYFFVLYLQHLFSFWGPISILKAKMMCWIKKFVKHSFSILLSLLNLCTKKETVQHWIHHMLSYDNSSGLQRF